MKSNKRRIRLLRRLAIAGCLAGFAVPATGAAMPLRADPPTSADAHSYSLPSGFHTEAQTVSPGPAKPFSLPAGFRTEAQRSAPSNTPSSSPSPVIREIRTVTNDGGHSLAIVLSSIALAIALGTAAYGVVRLTRLQRRVVGS
jgi:hypothetical protein